MKIFLLLVVVLIQFQTLCASPLLNRAYPSPDNQYSATVEYSDNAYHIQIKDSKDGNVLSSSKYEDVILYMKWDLTSKVLVAVHQLAGASYLSVVVKKDQQWHNYECDISEARANNDELQHSYVYKYDIQDNKLNVFWAYQVQSTITYETKRCGTERVVMNLSSGKIMNRTKKGTSYSIFEKLLSTAPWTGSG